LPEPATALRRVQPVRISRRSLEVVDLPSRKVGTTDVPAFALAIRLQHKCAFARANQHADPAHPLLLPGVRSRFISPCPFDHQRSEYSLPHCRTAPRHLDRRSEGIPGLATPLEGAAPRRWGWGGWRK